MQTLLGVLLPAFARWGWMVDGHGVFPNGVQGVYAFHRSHAVYLAALLTDSRKWVDAASHSDKLPKR